MATNNTWITICTQLSKEIFDHKMCAIKKLVIPITRVWFVMRQYSIVYTVESAYLGYRIKRTTA
jgi:hypothetical protein